MARGPFQGTYSPNSRPTIVTAPDAIVYINGETDIIGCPNCKRKFDFSRYITSIQTNLDIDSVPGSATVSMSIPRHVVDDFYQDGVPIVSPMMEIEMYAKGYYTLEGMPQYYPIFWGIITEVSDSYSSGEHTVTLNCADILKWWELCKMNVNPAFQAANPQLGRSIFGNVLYGTNPYDLIFTLAQMAFGDVVLGTGSLVSLTKEKGQKSTFNAAMGDIMQYWSSRFTRIRSNLLLYGVNGVAVRGDSVVHSYETGGFTPSKGSSPIANAVRNANGGPQSAQLAFDPSDPDVTAFRTQFGSAGAVNFWQSEYQTKLEIANACKESIGFEFYMDVTGDIVFKPPFYNLDIISNKPISWIQDIDVIDWDFSESDAEVVTQLSIQGSFSGNVDYGFGPDVTPFTSVTDYHLLRKYGWRPQTYNSEFMGDLTRMFYHGMDILDRFNSRRFQGTVTIPMRPELRLGFPIYVSSKDQVWYIKGISHNISFGGRATTTLTLTARRQKYLAIQGISTLKPGGLTPELTKKLQSDSDKYIKKVREATLKGKTIPETPATLKKVDASSIRGIANRTFVLDLGDAATIPPIGVDPNNPSTSDPYKPLILRHPKTGKIVGYPNVVMVYTRPYDSSQAFSSLAGQGNTKNRPVSKLNQAQLDQRKKTQDDGIKQAYTMDRTQELQDRYSNNRYSYGINSAGVYVYAHDVGKLINQFALIPSKNIEKVGDSESFNEKGIKLESPSSMVRPVSDERGFEVIGHFRYGRGVSLRDGALIYNEGQTNKRTEPQSQLALSGDVFSTLTAQSQGLTTLVNSYPNPSDAVARLQPEDLQTAGTWTKGSDNGVSYQFTSVGTDGKNFVDTAPLGSAEDRGLPTSVEAGQLSRALTLAEMTVRSDFVPGDTTCPCQTGRSDLAFMAVGYQLKSLTPSAPTEGSTEGTITSFSGEDLSSPVLPKALSSEEAMNLVDNYLWDLYSKLDEPHQIHEESLRGNLTGSVSEFANDPPRGDLFTTSNVEPEQDNFSPPFGAMNRSALGDPEATALQGSSAISDLEKSFSEFGSNLKANTSRAKLTTEISFLEQKIQRLNQRLEDITPTPGTVRITGSDTVEGLEKQISETQEEKANKEAELAQLV